jgi:A/G-specific adenine glycosylase
MLQQTRVETVIPYYLRFLKRFPSVGDLASASEEQVLALWSGLGYYRRARALLAGARHVADNHGGRFPEDLARALEIPGVGPYTAAAVTSIAYDRPHPVVDGNVERVATRVLRFAGNPRTRDGKRRVHELLVSWMPARGRGDFNQAMMELGATVCTPALPRCPSCPLGQVCEAHRGGDPERFPRLPARRKTIAVEFELGVLRRRDRYLLERESRFSFLEDLWLFPLVERAPGGDGRNGRGIARALSGRLGTDVREVGDLKPLRHSITYRRITLWPKVLAAPRVDLRGKRTFRWARLDQLGEEVPVSSLCLKLARRLEQGRQ